MGLNHIRDQERSMLYLGDQHQQMPILQETPVNPWFGDIGFWHFLQGSKEPTNNWVHCSTVWVAWTTGCFFPSWRMMFFLIQSKHVANFGTENSSPILHQFFGMYQTVIKSIIFFKDFCSERYSFFFWFLQILSLTHYFLTFQKDHHPKFQAGWIKSYFLWVFHQPMIGKNSPYPLSTEHQAPTLTGPRLADLKCFLEDQRWCAFRRPGSAFGDDFLSLGGKNLWSWGVLIGLVGWPFVDVTLKKPLWCYDLVMIDLFDDGIGLMYD